MKNLVICVYLLLLSSIAFAADGDIVATSKKGDACYTPPLERGKEDAQLTRGKQDAELTRGKDSKRQ